MPLRQRRVAAPHLRILVAIGIYILTLPYPLWGQFSFGPDLKIDDTAPGTVFIRTESGGQRCVGCLGDTVFVVWGDNRDGSSIYFSRSLDGGETFETNIRIDDVATAHTPCMAIGPEGNVYVVWHDFRQDPYGEIYLDRSTDGGETFGQDILVDGGYGARNACVATCPASGDIYVVWRDGRLGGAWHTFIARSDDAGTSFSQSIQADDTWSYLSTTYPAVAVGPDNAVYVGWVDSRQMETHHIYVTRSDDHGETFATSVDAMAGRTSFALTVSASGVVYVSGGISGSDFGGPYQLLRVARSIDRAGSFQAPVTVSEEVVGPSLVVDQHENLYIAFSNTAWDEIFFAFSHDGGITFSTPELVSDVWSSEIQTRWPGVAVDGSGKVYVAWSDSRDAPPDHAYRNVYVDTGTAPTSIRDPHQPGISDSSALLPELRADPNPFYTDLAVSYSLGSSGSDERSRIEVYSVQGRRIRVLPVLPGGNDGALIWDGMDSRGCPAQPGVYFLRLIVGDQHVAERVVLAR